MTRILLAAVLGGIVSFVWGFASHVILGLGQEAFSGLPNSDAVIASLEGQPEGTYMFPWVEPEVLNDPESAEAVAFTESYLAGPTGMVIYQPTGEDLMGPKKMGTEFGVGVLICALMAFVCCRSRCGFAGRWGLCITMGLISFLAMPVALWNWYRFPADFMIEGAFYDTVLASALAGLVIAAVVRPAEET